MAGRGARCARSGATPRRRDAMEPIHEAPLERQVALAAVEQRHIDAFEGGAPIPAKDLARALRADGLAHVEDVLDGATASALLAHVNRRLDCALAASDGPCMRYGPTRYYQDRTCRTPNPSLWPTGSSCSTS